MTEYGHMGVDWEERINFDRLRRERLAKVRTAMEKLDTDALMVFRHEHTRYITGFRFLWYPVPNITLPRTILTRDGAPILYCDSYANVTKDRLPWMAPENIRPWGNPEEWKRALGKHVEGKIGIDTDTRSCKRLS
jgi:Xaa-Pro dipeptidase